MAGLLSGAYDSGRSKRTGSSGKQDGDKTILLILDLLELPELLEKVALDMLPVIPYNLSRHSRIMRALSRISSSVMTNGGEMRNAVSQ